MNDLEIKISSYSLNVDDFIVLEFDNIPKLVVDFLISKKIKGTISLDDFEPIQLVYAGDKNEFINLCDRIEELNSLLDTKNLNENLFLAYLNEIDEVIQNMGLSDKQKIKK